MYNGAPTRRAPPPQAFVPAPAAVQAHTLERRPDNANNDYANSNIYQQYEYDCPQPPPEAYYQQQQPYGYPQQQQYTSPQQQYAPQQQQYTPPQQQYASQQQQYANQQQQQVYAQQQPPPDASYYDDIDAHSQTRLAPPTSDAAMAAVASAASTTSRNSSKRLAAPSRRPSVAGRRRCCCCCCLRSKMARIACAVFVVVLLVAAGIITYFFFPRVPSFKVTDVQVVPGTDAIGPSPIGGFAVSLGMLLVVSVLNPNPYNFRVESINLDASLVPNASQLAGAVLGPTGTPLQPVNGFGQPIGQGSFPNFIVFPPNKNTTFVMNFTLQYTTKTPFTQDIALAEILQGCGFLNGPPRPMVISYKANAVIGIFQPFGYTPTFEDDIRVNCPGPIGNALASFNLGSFGLNASPPQPQQLLQSRKQLKAETTSATRSNTTALQRFSTASSAILPFPPELSNLFVKD